MKATATATCTRCKGRGVDQRNRYRNPDSGKMTGHLKLCTTCNGQGIYYDNPERPCDIPPGEEKVALLAARYGHGVHLWHDEDAGLSPAPFDDTYIPTADMAAAVAVEKVSTRNPRV